MDEFCALLPSGGRVLDLCCGAGYETGRIRERGYDYTEQMMTKGIWGISVPIFDVRGKLIGGISTGDHIENNSPEYIRERLDQLKQLAVQIQEAMNGL